MNERLANEQTKERFRIVRFRIVEFSEPKGLGRGVVVDYRADASPNMRLPN